ncbi:uncharacterized protein LOC114198792 [Eumetopias jubatus]|uniref:uncharacterized protein LOC114198792 n=1 Tax=Eumetopias jubatus TaxID=34886 RepID=UPI001015E5D7|nr:uncharacterized protein LOC114198792 [Eumetopias jubatus]
MRWVWLVAEPGQYGLQLLQVQVPSLFYIQSAVLVQGGLCSLSICAPHSRHVVELESEAHSLAPECRPFPPAPCSPLTLKSQAFLITARYRITFRGPTSNRFLWEHPVRQHQTLPPTWLPNGGGQSPSSLTPTASRCQKTCPEGWPSWMVDTDHTGNIGQLDRPLCNHSAIVMLLVKKLLQVEHLPHPLFPPTNYVEPVQALPCAGLAVFSTL